MKRPSPGPSSSLPRLRGVYALELQLAQPHEIVVGRFGRVIFPAQRYVYLGSAGGPGGLQARLGRHLRGDTLRPHWHIDALRAAACVQAYALLAFSEAEAVPAGLECRWSQAVQGWAGASVIQPGFGASDCRLGCPAHLLALPLLPAGSQPYLQQEPLLRSLVEAAGVDCGRILANPFAGSLC